MSDQNPTTTTADTTTAPLKRLFKIGNNRIAEDAATAKLSNEQVRVLLKSQYPEIANATIRETVSGETRLVEYIQQPGRKG
jgi:PRTRC genetic system protein C